MNDAAEIPVLAEPLFLALEANVELHPVMTSDDLGRAGAAIERAAQRYPG